MPMRPLPRPVVVTGAQAHTQSTYQLAYDAGMISADFLKSDFWGMTRPSIKPSPAKKTVLAKHCVAPHASATATFIPYNTSFLKVGHKPINPSKSPVLSMLALVSSDRPIASHPAAHPLLKSKPKKGVHPHSKWISLPTLTGSSGKFAFPFTPYSAQPYNTPFYQAKVLKNPVKELDMTLGKSHVLALRTPATRVSISNPEVATALVLSPTQIQLVGKRVGVANLLIWDAYSGNHPSNLDISVHRDVSVLAKQLRILDPAINIIPMAAEDSVILTGTVDSPETAQLAAEVAKAFFGSGGGSRGGAGAAPAAISGSALPSSGSGGAGGDSGGPNSQAPGSAQPRQTPSVMNWIKIKGQPTTKLALVRNKLHEIDPNIQLDIVPGPSGSEKAILTGKVHSAGVVSRAINTTSIFYGQPGMKVLTGPGGNMIRVMGGPEFQKPDAFSNNMDINILQGSIVTDTSGNVISMLEVAHRPQILCHIKILDISRNDLSQLGATVTGLNQSGLGFTSQSGAQSSLRPITTLGNLFTTPTGTGFLTGANGTRSSGTLNNSAVTALGQFFGQGLTQVVTIDNRLTAAVSAFIEHKKIRSLAEPTLTLLSGEKGSFLAGGEIPIPVASQNGQVSVTFKEFGIRLNVMPTLKDDGRIHLQVAPEVSSVDQSISIPTGAGISVPGFKTRRMQTTLEVDNNQSFIMGGLFSQDEADNLSKFPGLGSVPVLGALFRNTNHDRRNNELIVIIQPEVVWEK